MTETEIRQTLVKLLKGIAPDTAPETLTSDDNIRQVLGLDSFDYLQFIIGFSQQFNIQTPEEDYGNIATLKTLIPYIATKIEHEQSKRDT